MGMFDTVHMTCPHCQGKVSLQSKAGACLLKNYGSNSIPTSVAEDLHNCTESYNTTCHNCNKRYVFKSDGPLRVSGRLEAIQDNIVKVTKSGDIVLPVEDSDNWD